MRAGGLTGGTAIATAAQPQAQAQAQAYAQHQGGPRWHEQDDLRSQSFGRDLGSSDTGSGASYGDGSSHEYSSDAQEQLNHALASVDDSDEEIMEAPCASADVASGTPRPSFPLARLPTSDAGRSDGRHATAKQPAATLQRLNGKLSQGVPTNARQSGGSHRDRGRSEGPLATAHLPAVPPLTAPVRSISPQPAPHHRSREPSIITPPRHRMCAERLALEAFGFESRR